MHISNGDSNDISWLLKTVYVFVSYLIINLIDNTNNINNFNFIIIAYTDILRWLVIKMKPIPWYDWCIGLLGHFFDCVLFILEFQVINESRAIQRSIFDSLNCVDLILQQMLLLSKCVLAYQTDANKIVVEVNETQIKDSNAPALLGLSNTWFDSNQSTNKNSLFVVFNLM